jgi:hypothetical protein
MSSLRVFNSAGNYVVATRLHVSPPVRQITGKEKKKLRFFANSKIRQLESKLSLAHFQICISLFFAYICALLLGELAQLARALALQARGHRFDSDILHKKSCLEKGNFFLFKNSL